MRKLTPAQDNITILRKTVEELLKEHDCVLVAIDGRCASGKTTLATSYANAIDCNVFHMDDFFPRPSQRTAERLQEPGGNVDYERFRTEVLEPLRKGVPFRYSPFRCATKDFGESITVLPKRINIIEGSYACHPALWNFYDYRIFMNVGQTEQMNRIRRRNPDSAETFQNRWIPLEERYFYEYHILERCNRVLDG